MVKDKDVDEGIGPKKGWGGLMVGLVNLLEKLNQVAEQGGEVVRTFEIERGNAPSRDKPLKGVVGFSIRTMGEGDESVKVEPFGNIRHNEATGESVVDEVREPLVDVFDEDQRLLIVAEMPGVEPNDVRVDLEEGTLTLSAERGELRFRKTLAVPPGLPRDKLTLAVKNGIVQIEVPKRAGGEERGKEGGP
jgi:HSP20 family protein